MTRRTSEKKDPHERNTEIALFRYGLIAPLLFDPLAAGELEKALRQIASKTYAIPYSSRTKVGVSTLRRYLQLYNQGGFEALRPKERADKGTPRVFGLEVLEKAIALREEQPARGQRSKTNSRTVRGNVRKTMTSGRRKLEKT